MVNSSTNVNAVGRDWNGIIDLACVKKCYEINKLERMRYKADKWR